MANRNDTINSEETSRVRVGVRTRSLAESRLRYIRQLGATDTFVDHADVDVEPDAFNDRDEAATLPVGRDTIPTVTELEAARGRIEDTGLRLTGIQSLPYSLYGDIMFGREGTDDALQQTTTLIENLGAASIPVLGYQWNPRGIVPMRTAPETLRGGAVGTAFDLEEIDDPDALAPGIEREYTEAEFWDNYEGFLETALLD